MPFAIEAQQLVKKVHRAHGLAKGFLVVAVAGVFVVALNLEAVRAYD